jgi:Uma2 family endonuclease
MNEQTFDELEQRLWTNPDSLTDEELEQLLQVCLQKEQESIHAYSLPAVA